MTVFHAIFHVMQRPRRLGLERLEPRVAMCAGPLTMQAPVDLTSYEQQMLELVNTARADPVAEASRLGISLNEDLPAGTLGSEPRQPLAPNSILRDVAEAHSRDMIKRRFFDHINPDGTGPDVRAVEAGYHTSYVGENLSSRGLVGLTEAVQLLHDSLFLSAGHRVNMLLGGYREAGFGLLYDTITFTDGNVQDGSIVTQLFGGGYPGSIYVTGVAYDDTTANQRFDVGEGRGGIIVEARDLEGNSIATTTGASGGYSLKLDTGDYRLFAFNADRTRVMPLGLVSLTSRNVKQDVSVERLNQWMTVNESIVVNGINQTLSMSDPNMNLVDVCQIDIRGVGPNRLHIDTDRLREAAMGRPMMVIANRDDTVVFDDGWTVDGTRLEDGRVVRRLENEGLQLDLVGPSDLTNPLDVADVDASGSLTAVDALNVINELAARRYSIDGSGDLQPIDTLTISGVDFFDVSGDGSITSLDALLVINQMATRQGAPAVGELIVFASESDDGFDTEHDTEHDDDARPPARIDTAPRVSLDKALADLEPLPQFLQSDQRDASDEPDPGQSIEQAAELNDQALTLWDGDAVATSL